MTPQLANVLFTKGPHLVSFKPKSHLSCLKRAAAHMTGVTRGRTVRRAPETAQSPTGAPVAASASSTVSGTGAFAINHGPVPWLRINIELSRFVCLSETLPFDKPGVWEAAFDVPCALRRRPAWNAMQVRAKQTPNGPMSVEAVLRSQVRWSPTEAARSQAAECAVFVVRAIMRVLPSSPRWMRGVRQRDCRT